MTTLDKLIELEKKRTQGKWRPWFVTTSPQENPKGEMVPLIHGAAPPHELTGGLSVEAISKAGKDGEWISAMSAAAPLLLEIWKSALAAEKSFMQINDGFFTGLVPPEFATVSIALRALSNLEAMP